MSRTTPVPPITGYEIRYRKGTAGNFYTPIREHHRYYNTIAHEDARRPLLTTLDERLTRNNSYEVHVKANTEERDSAWSALATGRTSKGNQDCDFR